MKAPKQVPQHFAVGSDGPDIVRHKKDERDEQGENAKTPSRVEEQILWKLARPPPSARDRNRWRAGGLGSEQRLACYGASTVGELVAKTRTES